MAPRIRVIEGGKSARAGETALFDEQFVDLGRDGGPSARLARDVNVSVETQRAFEIKGRMVAQTLSGHFAWGSVAWFVGVLAGVSAVGWAVLAGPAVGQRPACRRTRPSRSSRVPLRFGPGRNQRSSAPRWLRKRCWQV